MPGYAEGRIMGTAPFQKFISKNPWLAPKVTIGVFCFSKNIREYVLSKLLSLPKYVFSNIGTIVIGATAVTSSLASLQLFVNTGECNHSMTTLALMMILELVCPLGINRRIVNGLWGKRKKKRSQVNKKKQKEKTKKLLSIGHVRNKNVEKKLLAN